MRIRLLATAVACAVVGATLVAPAPAMAAAKRTWSNIPTWHSDGWGYGRPWIATTTGSFGVGDCTETNGGVAIYPPDQNGRALVEWLSGALRTTHTTNFDQWHQRFTFKSSWGTVLATASGFDGPRMYDTYRDYYISQAQSVQMDPQLWQYIALVDWSAEC